MKSLRYHFDIIHLVSPQNLHSIPLHQSGQVVWVELDPEREEEQVERRAALIVASDLFLAQADDLAIIVPGTTVDRGWRNHVLMCGPDLKLPVLTFAMTERIRTITRARIVGHAGSVDRMTMFFVDQWLSDFFGGRAEEGQGSPALWRVRAGEAPR